MHHSCARVCAVDGACSVRGKNEPIVHATLLRSFLTTIFCLSHETEVLREQRSNHVITSHKIHATSSLKKKTCTHPYQEKNMHPRKKHAPKEKTCTEGINMHPPLLRNKHAPTTIKEKTCTHHYQGKNMHPYQRKVKQSSLSKQKKLCTHNPPLLKKQQNIIPTSVEEAITHPPLSETQSRKDQGIYALSPETRVGH